MRYDWPIPAAFHDRQGLEFGRVCRDYCNAARTLQLINARANVVANDWRLRPKPQASTE